MCWSRPTQTPPPAPTTARAPVIDSIECTTNSSPCKDNTFGCLNGGICCLASSNNQSFCVCKAGFKGHYCELRGRSYSKSSGFDEAVQLRAGFVAVVGILVFIAFIGVICLQVKYYRSRKRRRQEDEKRKQEMLSSPVIGRRKDDACVTSLRAHPGYSWRQSVRRASSYTSQKLCRLPSSSSTPDDLFKLVMDEGFEVLIEEANQMHKIRGVDATGSDINFADEEKKERCSIPAQMLAVEGDAVQFQTAEEIVRP